LYSGYRCKAEAGNDARKKKEQTQTLGKIRPEEDAYGKDPKTEEKAHDDPKHTIFLDALPSLFDAHDREENDTGEENEEDCVNDEDEEGHGALLRSFVSGESEDAGFARNENVVFLTAMNLHETRFIMGGLTPLCTSGSTGT
jgi:hypothetical protein